MNTLILKRLGTIVSDEQAIELASQQSGIPKAELSLIRTATVVEVHCYSAKYVILPKVKVENMTLATQRAMELLETFEGNVHCTELSHSFVMRKVR